MNEYQKLKDKRMDLNDFELKLILLGLTIGGFVGMVIGYLGYAFTIICTSVLLFSLFTRTAWPLYKDLKVRWSIRKIKKAKKSEKSITPTNEEKETTFSSSPPINELSIDPDTIDTKVEPQYDFIKKN